MGKVDKVYDSTYVTINGLGERKKDLLNAVKETLFVEEKIEKIKNYKKKKDLILSEVKKSVAEIKDLYNETERLFPDIKNFVPYAEQEIREIGRELENMRNQKRILEEQTQKSKNLLRNLSKIRPEQVKDVIEQTKLDMEDKPDEKTKIDRIKNNLKFIQDKLDKI